MGYNAVVVNYITNAPYPQSLKDASDTIVYVRKHSEEWNTDSDRIFVCGFSAGGHLAACIGIMADKEEAIKREDKLNKPNRMILYYPVISSGEFAHRGSFNAIGTISYESLGKTSLELQENGKTYTLFELHIYPNGVDGLSLVSEITGVVNKHVQSWLLLGKEWLKTL